MARWKLTEPHYLSVPSERWEHTTIDSRTGKPVRKMFRVPKHLDPRLEDDWNVRINGMDGEIHVCYEGKDDPKYPDRAIVFEGNPTPGMLPLDDEAKEISGQFSWTPTQGIDEESQRHSFYAKLGDTLINQMTELKDARETALVNPSMDKFMETMLAMMAQNQQILAALAGKVQPAIHPDQVIDVEEPLPEVEPTEAELHEAALEAYAKEALAQKSALNRMTSRRI